MRSMPQLPSHPMHQLLDILAFLLLFWSLNAEDDLVFVVIEWAQC